MEERKRIEEIEELLKCISEWILFLRDLVIVGGATGVSLLVIMKLIGFLD